MSNKIASPLSLMKNIVSKVRAMFNLPNQIRELNNQIRECRDLVLFGQNKLLQSNHPNPLNRSGRKCFSQTDEDGITLEILNRIDRIDAGVYAELGVGDGTENNTLILVALGWKGVWIGEENLAFQFGNGEHKKLAYLKEWITLENIADLLTKGLAEIGANAFDVISIDLDGNDIYFVEKILTSDFKPKLFIVEYNAKFPPPVQFQITYDPHHTWNIDDYFGASLSSFDRLFCKFNYRLVCCNSHTGGNAFFIDSAYSEFFSDVPTDINQIYVEPRYHLYDKYGHDNSARTIERIFDIH